MAYLSHSKTYKGVADVFLRDPDRYGPLLQFIDAVMTGKSELSKAEREMIASHVSKLNGCGFCLGAHKWTLAAMDIDPNLIAAAEAGIDSNHLDERMQSVLRFAAKLTRKPKDIDQSDIDALLSAGWSDQAIEDAINVISIFNYVNRLVDAFGIEGSESYFKQVGKVLATEGYAPLIERTSRNPRRPYLPYI